MRWLNAKLISSIIILATASSTAIADQMRIANALKSRSHEIYACLETLEDPQNRICASLQDVSLSDPKNSLAIGREVVGLLSPYVREARIWHVFGVRLQTNGTDVAII